jgi:hypothetical protein
MTTTTNDNLDARLTALIESYADAANWRVKDDGDSGFAYDRYRIEVCGAPPGWAWGWTIEPRYVFSTAAEAKADALVALVWLIWPKGAPGMVRETVENTLGWNLERDGRLRPRAMLRFFLGLVLADAQGEKARARRHQPSDAVESARSECVTAMLCLNDEERARVVEALRDWIADADEGPSP